MKLISSVVLACSTAAAVASAAEIVVNRVVDDFLWSDPFGEHATPPGFEAPCEAVGEFKARQYRLSALKKEEPEGLLPWSNALKYFFGGRPFPGSWDGVDEHGILRDVIMMQYADVPEAVKRWIEAQKDGKDADGSYLFGVYHRNKEGIKIKGTATPRPRVPYPKPTAVAAEIQEEIDAEAARLPPDEDLVVLFAAGALYHVLPLWVAELSSTCKAELLDLSRYGTELKDGGVAAWVVEHTKPDAKAPAPEITFKVKAQLLKETEAGRASRIAREKEEAYASAAANAAAKAADASQEAKESKDAASSAETEKPTKSVKDEL